MLLCEQRCLPRESGQGRSQLVRDVGGEAPLARLSLRERADLLLECLGHLVERRRPDTELVVGLDRKPRLEEPLGERMSRFARLRDRAKNAAGNERTSGCRESDHSDPADEEDRLQLRKVVAQLLLGEEEVELGLRRWRPSARDEVRRVRDPDSLEREVALLHECLHARRNVCPVEREGRREPLILDDRGRLETGASGIEGEQVGAFPACASLSEKGVREQEVRPCLLDRALDGVVEPSVPDDQIGPEREDPGRERGDEREGDRETPSQPSHEGDALHQPRSSR